MAQRPDDEAAEDGTSESEQHDFESTRRRDRWQLWTLTLLLVLMVAEIVFLCLSPPERRLRRRATQSPVIRAMLRLKGGRAWAWWLHRFSEFLLD